MARLHRATVAEARTRARTTHVRILTSASARQHTAGCLALLLARAAQMAVRTRAHITLHYPPISVILESLPVPRGIQGFSLSLTRAESARAAEPAQPAGRAEGTADRIRRRHWIDGRLLLRPIAIPCHRLADPAASAWGSARKRSAERGHARAGRGHTAAVKPPVTQHPHSIRRNLRMHRLRILPEHQRFPVPGRAHLASLSSSCALQQSCFHNKLSETVCGPKGFTRFQS